MPTTTNVATYLGHASRQCPDVAAVLLPQRRQGQLSYTRVTYEQLESQASAIACALELQGVGRGCRVLLMVKPGFELILCVFALFKVGAVPVVIDPGMGWEHFRTCVRRSRPDVLLGIKPAVLLSPLLLRGYRFQRKLSVGVGWWRQALGQASTAQPYPAADVAPNELAAVLFTSGSTGPAKGVCYTHGIFDAQVRLLKRQYGFAPGEVDLTLLPVFALFNPALGMTTVVPEMDPAKPAQADPAKIIEAIRLAGVTNSFGSPTLWRNLVAYCEAQDITLPTVKRIQMAGAPVPPDLIARLQGILPSGEVNTPYGATEALPVSTISGREVIERTRALTLTGQGTCIGRTFDEIQLRVIRICDEPLEMLSEELLVPSGELGELVVSGPVVTRSYDALPEATAAAKLRDPQDPDRIWHRMGDIGRADEQGYIWFLGRKAERVQTACGTLYTDPCEAIFNQHPAVARSALIGLGDPGEQTPAVVIEPEAGKFASLKMAEKALMPELLALAQEHQTTAVIKRFFFKQRFPVDVRHNAKIHRLSLAREFTAQG
ncbi:MAG: fatty acid CoA ligase family protein [Verrucomicrobiota bacterium]